MSFSRYPKYKASGVKWLGEVPEHWSASHFSRVIHQIKDGTHGTFLRVDSGRPLLSAKNVQDGYIEFGSEESLIDEADYRSIVSNGFPQRNDLLLTIVGTIGRAAVFDSDEPFAFQRSVCFIRLVQGNSPRYFLYATQSKFFQEQLVSRSKSSAQAGIYMGDVKETQIAFPPSQGEQDAVSSFLDQETAKIDALIEEQRRLIELLKEKRQAFVSHAVTKGLEGTAKMKPSGVEWIGEIPVHWAVRRVGHIFDERDERSTTGQEEMLSVSHLTGVTRRSEKTVYMFEAETNEGYKLCKAGDLVVNTLWGWMGAMGTAFQNGMVSPAYNIYIPSADIKPDFVDAIVRTRAFVDEVTRYSKGVWSSRLRIYPVEFFQLSLPVPLLEEQVRITKAIRKVSSECDRLCREAEKGISLLQERRSALISAAVTGKIDVRKYAPQEIPADAEEMYEPA